MTRPNRSGTWACLVGLVCLGGTGVYRSDNAPAAEARDAGSDVGLLRPGSVGADPAEVIASDVCVVGGGSGGVGAALAASRAGANVVLIEKMSQLGGTSTLALVSSWEPGPGDSLAREIYQRLKDRGAAGVTSDANADRKQGPFGLWRVTSGLDYEASLHRAGRPRSEWHGVAFDPAAMSQVMAELLAGTGKCRVLLNRRLVNVLQPDRRVLSVDAQAADGSLCRVRARVFIDATGDAVLCRIAGCVMMLGAEPRYRFHEPDAPEAPDRNLNAISLCYRIRPAKQSAPPAEPGSPVTSFPRSAHVVEMPGGDRIVNPLGLLPGQVLLERGYERTLADCRPIVEAHWRWLHQYPAFAGYEYAGAASMLGIRESFRVEGEYVLVQQDLQTGLAGQGHKDIIAVADHALDVHGSGRRSGCTELQGPYGIPYRCLIPRGRENLLVACRGASFSQIAASSCRLSRTMLSLGRAAGLAAAMAAEAGVPVTEIDVARLRKELGVP